jgi:predicted DCC family thiol-disulfide oxidoreductase YuxK
MAKEHAQAPAGSGGAHLVLYDGVCGLCNRLLQFLLAHDRRAVFSFAPLQGPTAKSLVARFGGNPTTPTLYVCANFRTDDARVMAKSDGALSRASLMAVESSDGRPCRAEGPPRCPYDVVARIRYRVFGRYEQCLAPRPEFRSRFVE